MRWNWNGDEFARHATLAEFKTDKHLFADPPERTHALPAETTLAQPNGA